MTDIGKASSAVPDNKSTSKTTGKDEFMRMLLAQLQNQNPLDPMDGKDFAAQLAQFSSLEQLSNINTKLESLAAVQQTQNVVTAANLIGKQVSAIRDSQNKITVTSSTAELNYTLSKDAQKVTVKIYDADGVLVKTLEETDQSAGGNKMTWECGEAMQGTYTYEVSAEDSAGNKVPVNTKITGIVTDVQFKGRFILVTVDGQQIPFENIVEVGTAPEA